MLRKRSRILPWLEELEDRTVPTLLGQQLFPVDNPWNQDISNAPVAANSANVIANIGANVELHPDFGQFYANGNDLYGIPYNIVSGTQAKVNVIIDEYPDESDLGDVPIPAGAVIEGDFQNGPKPFDDRGDSHLIVWDKDNNIAYELYRASRPNENGNGGTWHAAGQAIWDMNTNQFRTLGWTSADAAGLSILAGLVRPDEGLPVSEGGQGVINHAIRFTLTNSKVLGQYIYPASHIANSGTNTTTQVPMGARFRLKAGVDISLFNPQAKIIAQAMKTYGLILADNGSSMYFSGASYAVDATNNVTLTWDDDDIQDQTFGLKSLSADDFELIDLTPIVTEISPSTALPGSMITVTGQNFSGSASSGGPNRLWVLFGDEAVPATYVSDTEVTAIVPIGVTPGTVVSVKVRSGIEDIESNSDNIRDPIFGYGDSTTSETFTFPTFPGVASITRADVNPNNTGAVDFTVTFSMDVTGVDLSDFTLTTTGVAAASLVSVTPVSASVYTVAVNTGSGDGTIRLDVVDDDSIENTLTMPLGDTGAGNGDFTTGQVYDIDKTGPTVTVNPAGGQADPASTAPILFTVTFSEAVNFTAANVTFGGSADPRRIEMSGSGATYTVAVFGMHLPGDVTMSVAAGVVSDPAGNLNTTSTGDGTVAFQLPPDRVAVFRNGKWVHDLDGERDFDEAAVTLGKKGDKPIRGDFDGDGVEENGVYRKGKWLIDLNHDGILNDGTFAKYGGADHKPIVGDWDGDGADDIGVFRYGKWWRDDGDRVKNEAAFIYGKKGYQPVVGDWDGDGFDDLGLFRKGQWYRDEDNDQIFSASADLFATFGQAGDKAVVGDWDGNGFSNLAVYRKGQWLLADDNFATADDFLFGGAKHTPLAER